MELTSLDLSLLMDELKKVEEGYVQQVYQRGNEFTLEIYVPGDEKKRLIIGPSYCFISDYKRDNPERPPGFCMELRKHLGKVESVEQRGFDRILEINCGEVKLIAELFGKGNVILLKNGKIIGSLRQEEYADRSILVGEDYEYPEPTSDPRGVEDYFDLLDEGELVRRLASDLSLGGVYAEEICARSDVSKNMEIHELDDKEKDVINKQIREILNPDMDPCLYVEDLPVRASPFPLKTYSEYEKEKFESFSKSLDEYYYRKEKREKEKKKEKAYREKREGIESQLEQQKRKKKGLKKSARQNREKAELIYQNYQLLEKIQEELKQSIKEAGWKKTEKKLDETDSELSDHINSVNEREEFISVEVDEHNVKLTLDEDLEAIASRYYDKAKESESKIESVEEAMEETREKLKEIEEEDLTSEKVMEDKTEERKKKWFEKYRWFYSSEDFLILTGRDSQTNEMLVKKHMEDNDLYLHADFDGAPSVVIKDGKEAGQETRQEAAKAAVTFSKTWKAGIGADNVYYVDPEQVTKNPESGEYLPKGAFVIRGERDYMRNISIEAAIGSYELEDDLYVPMCGPVKAVKENCPAYLELGPGNEKKSELAKNIQKKLREKGYQLDLDYIIRALPPGKSRLK